MVLRQQPFLRALLVKGTHTLAPIERRTPVSSKLPTKYLTTEELDLLQGILVDAGYTSDLLSGAPRDVAAKLLVRFFQEGVTDPTELATELERRFGRPGKKAVTFHGTPHHRYAICGLPPG